ncbi:MAG: aspartate carbamoyltransferase catalytic subunit [candidate division WOR-3 bacterium]|nr:aspartate carbamoyltransferase catalytic subunit [candidate division WOR-3 bacterium]MCX7947232.1 aspartate carbamoyltransferase catalytic subunit [candidate division WOR-3 bacterium]MDW8150287.1 aspartate carbamoyltransferase catalytic subunit [candidate division WOR-3 bacterium]
MKWDRKYLLSIDDLSVEDIYEIFQTAKSMKEIIKRPIKKVPTLRGKNVCLLFYEPSTRTRMSFENACKFLSIDTISFSRETSSLKKGETFLDTLLNIEKMGVDLFVIRHSSSGILHYIRKFINSKIVNGGDGTNEHPTQALLDGFTILENKNRIESLKITIVGDILHSRVARSNIRLFKKLGAYIVLCGPPTLLPKEFENMGVEISYNLKEAIDNADVIYVLRLQLERQSSNFFPTVREYNELFGIKKDILKYAKKDVIIMHPGPMNRGVEIDSDVADSNYSLILNQVENGVAIRMSILYYMLV